MTATPFTLVSESELRQLAEAVSTVVAEWAADWLGADEPLDVAVERLERVAENAAGELWYWTPAPGECVAMRLSAADREKWVGTMLQADRMLRADSGLAAALWEDAAGELASKVRIAAGMEGRPVGRVVRIGALPRDWELPGAGIVNARVSGALGTVQVLCPYRRAAVALGETAREAGWVRDGSLQGALSGNALTGEMVLASEEIALGELLDLQVGDVIALSQPCDQPVTLFVKEAGLTVSGYLGQRGGAKAMVVAGARTSE